MIDAQGATLDAAHPDQVVVYAPEQYNADNDPLCNAFAPSARLVSESATTVTIVTFAYSAARRTNGSKYLTCLVSDAPETPSGPRVTLKAPLGSRTLLDLRSGKQIAVFGPRAVPPAPTYLPAGYGDGSTSPVRAGADTTGFRTYSAGSGKESLEIHLASDSSWTLSDTPRGKAQIGAYPAVIYERDYERCVSWSADKGRHLEICSVAPTSHHYLSDAELIKVARSMP